MPKIKSKAKSGFVYLWLDRKHKRYYVGSHWGTVDDGYVCSSSWMRQAYGHRPQDFKRRIVAWVHTTRKDLLLEEQRWLEMIKPEELKVRYYNLIRRADHLWHADPQKSKTIGEKISAGKMGKKPRWTDPAQRAANISAGKLAKRPPKPPLEDLDAMVKAGQNVKTIAAHYGVNGDVLREWFVSYGVTDVRKLHPKRVPAERRLPGQRMRELWADPEWAARQGRAISGGRRAA